MSRNSRAVRCWWIADQSIRAIGIQVGDLVRVDLEQDKHRAQVSWPRRQRLPVRAFLARVNRFTPVSETEVAMHIREGGRRRLALLRGGGQ